MPDQNVKALDVKGNITCVDFIVSKARLRDVAAGLDKSYLIGEVHSLRRRTDNDANDVGGASRQSTSETQTLEPARVMRRFATTSRTLKRKANL